MKAYEIHLDDIGRILLGGTPPLFLVEAVFRTVIVYLLIMISMRAMGRRMSSELSRSELAALVSLAATVGIPLTDPDRGLLPAVLIAIIIVTLQRWLSSKVAASERFETKVQGHIDILIKDGVLILETMKESRLSRERLFAQLRANHIYNLGQVQRLYFEANGSFSLLEVATPPPGLCILPDWDSDIRDELKYDYEKWVCVTCGKLKEDIQPSSHGTCPECGGQSWQRPIISDH